MNHNCHGHDPLGRNSLGIIGGLVNIVYFLVLTTAGVDM